MTQAAQEISRCMPWIEDALQYAGGTHSMENVVEGIMGGQMYLWPGKAAAAVVEIVDYPQFRDCNLFLAGGDSAELRDMLRDCEAWAKEKGCTRVSMQGRKGWSRSWLADDGYEGRWFVMSKNLKEGA